MNGLKRYSTLSDVIQSYSNQSKSSITYITGEKEENIVSYGDLFTKAAGVLYNLQAAGIKPNDELIFQIEENQSFVYIFWACLLGNIIPIPLSIGNNDEHKFKLFNVWRFLNNPFLITNIGILNNMEVYAKKNSFDSLIQEISSKTLFIDDVMNTSSAGKFYNVKPSDTAFIQFSSGSTGDPKGVILSHENLISNIYAIINCSNVSMDDTSLSWVPLTHDLGMIGCHLTPIVQNINQYNMHASLFIRRPTLWIEKASETRVTILQSPNFGYKYFLSHFKPDMAFKWDLSSVRLIFNGAEPIYVDACNEFLNSLSSCGLKSNSIYSVYGMAEASLAVSFPRVGEGLNTVYLDREVLNVGEKVKEVDKNDPKCISFVEEGYPVDDCHVRLCNDNNVILGENIIGHIQISGKNITKGYYNNKAATERVFTSDGWLKTGDLGFIRNGKIVVTGRLKDIIFVNGINYYSHDLERIAEAVDGCSMGNVSIGTVPGKDMVGEEIIAFVAFNDKIEEFIPIVKKLKGLFKSSVGIVISHVVPVRNIPKTASGKIQRYKLEELYKNGEFGKITDTITAILDYELKNSLEENSVNTVEENLAAICKNIFDLQQVGVNDNFIDIGGSSMLIAQVHREIEKVYPGRVKISDLYAYPTISKIADLILNSNIIDIKRLKMPEEYLTSSEESEEIFYEFKLDPNVSKGVRRIAEVESADVGEILLSMYIFMLSQISGLNELTVQSVIGENGRIIPVSLDLNTITDISGLFKAMKDKLGNDAIEIGYYQDDIDRIKLSNEKALIAPLFCKNNIISINNDLLGVYDIVMQLNESEHELSFTCRCNGKKLAKNKVLKLINHYIKLINNLSERYCIV